MGELQKIVRVLKKVDPAAPHSVLLVLDATTGQNAHAQAEIFRETVGVTGIVMTKLDGTAQGRRPRLAGREIRHPDPLRSGSAKPPRICARSKPAPTPAAWSASTPDPSGRSAPDKPDKCRKKIEARTDTHPLTPCPPVDDQRPLRTAPVPDRPRRHQRTLLCGDFEDAFPVCPRKPAEPLNTDLRDLSASRGRPQTPHFGSLFGRPSASNGANDREVEG